MQSKSSYIIFQLYHKGEHSVLEKNKKKWEKIRADGFIRWWINEGIIKFLLPIFTINVFFVNPLIMNMGIAYFISKVFIKSIIINSTILIILSLCKAMLIWHIIDKQYKRETTKQTGL